MLKTPATVWFKTWLENPELAVMTRVRSGQRLLTPTTLQETHLCTCDLKVPVCPTFLRVVENLHLAFLGAEQGLGQLGQGALHSAGSHQKLASAGLLHYFCPGEAKHLAEAFVAVDDATLLHLGIANQKPAIWPAEKAHYQQRLYLTSELSCNLTPWFTLYAP